MHSRQILISLSLALLLSGCATGETFDEEARVELVDSLPELPADWQSTDEGDASPLGWVAAFDDPVLARLIEEALANNRSIAVAAANLDHSRALVQQARSGLKPALSVTGGGGRGGSSGSGIPEVDDRSLGAQLSWEIDVWGRLRAGASAAWFSNAALEADYHYAQQSLVAATARTYFTAIEARLQTRIAQENVEALEETLRIVTVRHSGGMDSAQDLALARSDLALTRDALVATEGSYREVIRALEALVGRYPGATLEVQQSLPAAPAMPPAGIPSELLERRPDLVAAERRVAASYSALAQAKAARLPSLSLTGNIGGSSQELSNLLDPANVAWRLGANLLAPLVDGGLRKAQVDAASADQRQAIAAYGQAALNAFGEVEGNLDQGVVIEQRARELEEAAAEADKAYHIANLRYKEGESDLLDVLTIQRRVISAQSNLLSIQRQRLEQRVGLHLAIGGDW